MELSTGDLDMSVGFPQATGDIESLFAAAFGFPPDSSAPGALAPGPAYNVASLISYYAGYSAGDLTLRWADECPL